MDFTPNDIRNYEFTNALRGYDKDKVDEFVEQVATVLEEAKQETLKLSMELDSVRSQLTALKQFEDTIKNAAIDSRRNADILMVSAKTEAESILNDAKKVVQKTIDEHREQIKDVAEKVNQLDLVKKSYLTKLKNIISSHMELIDEVAELTAPAIDKSILDDVDAVEVDSGASETSSSATPAETANSEAEIGSASQEYKTAVAQSETPSEEEPPTEKLDPELAAALASYNADKGSPKAEEPAAPAPKAEEAVVVPEQSKVEVPPANRPPKVVETTALAEDIPVGFVAKNGSAAQPRPSANMPLENNSVDIDADVNKPEDKPAEDILSTLDEVAKKVDELDKA